MQRVFEGLNHVGSIFVSSQEALKISQVNDKNIKAIVLITKEQIFNLAIKIQKKIWIQLQDDQIEGNLVPYFSKVSKFIGDAKKHSNILIYCPSGLKLCYAFFVAYFIENCNHNYDYISNLHEKQLQKISFPKTYIFQLQNLEKSYEEKNQRLYEVGIGKRILKIRQKYPLFCAKHSRNHSSQNPEIPKTHRESSTSKFCVQFQTHTSQMTMISSKNKHNRRVSDLGGDYKFNC